jgi:hypothetical protein
MPTPDFPIPAHVSFSCCVCGHISYDLVTDQDGAPMCPDEIRCMSRAIRDGLVNDD